MIVRGFVLDRWRIAQKNVLQSVFILGTMIINIAGFLVDVESRSGTMQAASILHQRVQATCTYDGDSIVHAINNERQDAAWRSAPVA